MSKIIPVTDVKETYLYKELIRRGNEHTRGLVGNLSALCDEASNRAKSINTFFPEFTLHDQTHFLRVTQLMALVVGDTLDQLNDVEISLLILAAFFHDQGMILEGSDKEMLVNSDHFLLFRQNWLLDHPNYLESEAQLTNTAISQKEYERIFKSIQSLESALLTDYLRNEHGQRSYDHIIYTYSNDHRLAVSGVNLSRFLALICLSHVQEPEWIQSKNGLNADENIGIYKVNMALIAIVLRLADILDFDADRTPEVLFRSIHFTSPVSVIEWQKHRSVQGWEISPTLVRFTMSFEHPVYEKCARDFLDWIDKELVTAHQLIRNFPREITGYQLAIPEKTSRDRISAKNNSYVFHDLEFSLSRDEVIKLLMTNNLYKSPSLFIRELLQNSLDALRLRKANFEKDGVIWDKGKVDFRHAIDDNGEHFVECIDNGCGMDMISRFFGKVGRSYYRSPEFQRHRLSLKSQGVDFEPCSQFGIGFMSCFMIGDRIEIYTRKDYGAGMDYGLPLIIEINGLGGLMVIKEGSVNQQIGTKVKVYCRDKPWIYDAWTDNIRLLTVLKGYALGNEFPINAVCDIEEIRESVTIPVEVDKKITFLEEFGLKSVKTFEVDLRTINPNLNGFLRQSFLVDNEGKLCLENDDARWDVIGDENWTNKSLTIAIIDKKTSKTEQFRRYIRESDTVCLDGILICGSPGRHFHTRTELMQLGMRSSLVHVEHPYTIDVRGDIKPEITPAREPADGDGIFRLPTGWRRLQRMLDMGSGDLWKQVLSECSSELFWTLLTIYYGDPLEIPLNALFKYGSLPVDDGKWIRLADIDCSYYSEDKITVVSLNGVSNQLQMLDSIARFDLHEGAPRKNWNYLFEKILIGMSNLEVSGNQVLLKMRRSFKPDERPFDSRFQAYHSNIHCLEFVGLGNEYLCTVGYDNIVNLNNPLVQKGLQKYLNTSADDLQVFASSLIVLIPEFIKNLKENNRDINFNYKGRSLKIVGHHYLRVNWANYGSEFKPPYKIYVNEHTTLELTDHILQKWGRISPSEV